MPKAGRRNVFRDAFVSQCYFHRLSRDAAAGVANAQMTSSDLKVTSTMHSIFPFVMLLSCF